MFSFLKRKSVPPAPPITVDMHSHLLPGLDDGATDLAESMMMIEEFVRRGYKRLYTTPHILSDFYPNSAETILPALALVRAEIENRGLDIELHAAAEYFLDEVFLEATRTRTPLLTFSGNYVLFETAFLNRPVYLREVIFNLLSNGYQPVLAHPERYQYFYNNWKELETVFESGVLFQVNSMSLLGYYNPAAQGIAERLIEKGMVNFIGTDCHKPKHQEIMLGLEKNKHYKMALALPLRNREI